MKIKIFSLFSMVCATLGVYAQTFTGKVLDEKHQPLPGANIYWLGTTLGTTTNAEGVFELTRKDGSNVSIVVSFVGYQNDTLYVDSVSLDHIMLAPAGELNNVVITDRQSSSFTSITQPHLIETLTERELTKAACCNLSESFETNASVDVSYADAVTGSKNIQMLGLDGRYVNLTTELLPSIRGLASPFGLSYIAGPWMESIQISKGAGSVVNGYEGLTGQINVELKKPENSELLYVNGFASHMGRVEGNVNISTRLNPRWSTATLFHGDYFNTIADENNDDFLDMPLLKQGSLVHRWKFITRRVEGQFGAKVLFEQREGGTESFYRPDSLKPQYHFGMQTQRAELFNKTGILFPKKPYKSIGIMAQGIFHRQAGNFGNTGYEGIQKNGYLNIIYQSIFKDTRHKFKTGASLMVDDYVEQFGDTSLQRLELVPGGFFEYTFDNLRNVQVIAGLRTDIHNLYGVFVTPRLNVKYNIRPNLILRVSGGRGYRVPNVFSENTALLVSSRTVEISGPIEPEVAWNYGGSVQWTFKINGHDASLVGDYFRTDFTNQLMVDREDGGSLRFYNLQGQSYSNVGQLTLNLEPFKYFEVRLAWKYQDVRADFNGVRERVPLTPEHKGLLNLAYTFEKIGLKLDFTTTLTGPSRTPPSQLTAEGTTPWFMLMNAQISKDFKILEWYVGAENITGYTQQNPILGASNPNGQNFDASIVWAPIFGRMFYTGFRFKLNHKKQGSSEGLLGDLK